MSILEHLLEHSGIKGMKWGVRRSKVPKQGPSGDARTAHKALIKAKVSGSHALSNHELSALNNRLNLEQNFKRLSYNPSKLKRGFDQLTHILKAGNTVNDAIKFAESDLGVELGARLGSKSAIAVKAAKAAKKAT